MKDSTLAATMRDMLMIRACRARTCCRHNSHDTHCTRTVCQLIDSVQLRTNAVYGKPVDSGLLTALIGIKNDQMKN
jgi:hypothetical protein